MNNVLKPILLTAASTFIVPNIVKAEEKPNIIFILCDDLNYSIEGFGGHPQSITPNLKRLAASGVMFSNAMTNCPLSGPSRASLWSGLYPHTTGNFGYEQGDNPWRKNPVMKNTVTVFEHLSHNGYQVYATGKIQHNGTEDYNVYKDENGKVQFGEKANFGPFPTCDNPDYKDWGTTYPDMPAGMQKTHWDSGFGPIRDISSDFNGTGRWIYNNFKDAPTYNYKSETNRDLMPDERNVEYVKDVLKKQTSKPFMIAVGFNRPHAPMFVPQKYYDMYSLDTLKIATRFEDDLSDCSKSLYQDFDIGTKKYGFYKYEKLINAGGMEALKKWTQAYLACVSFVDEQVGQILDALEKSSYKDNTIIIFTGDNGYHMGQKNQLFKNSVWEESCKEPLIIAGYSVKKQAVCKTPVSLIDLYPTIVDYCGLPENPNVNTNGKKLDGFSLRSLLTNPEVGKWKGPKAALSAIASNQKIEPNTMANPKEQHYSVRSEQYRYIHCRNGEEELYDHFADPYEQKNLASDPAYKKIIKELKQFIP
jgi:arylsulfatase A-like enzyme